MVLAAAAYCLTAIWMAHWHAVQPIDEFPQFSFFLADSHPHVMALPFVLLTLGLALNLLLTWRDPNPGRNDFLCACGWCTGIPEYMGWPDLYYWPLWVRMGCGGLCGAGSVCAQRSFERCSALDAVLLILTVVFYLPFL